MRAFRKDQMHFAQRVEQREAVGHDRGVVGLTEERHAQVQQRVERFEELASIICSANFWHGASEQLQAVLMRVFRRAPLDRQTMLLVLHPAPDEVVQRP